MLIFSKKYIYHQKNGSKTWSGDCDATWIYSSVKTDRLIEKVITCVDDLCNKPSKIPSLEDSFLCDDGFYINRNRALNSTVSKNTTMSHLKNVLNSTSFNKTT